jgi:hypothetical protein
MPQSHTMNSTFSAGIRLRNPKFIAQIVIFAFAGAAGCVVAGISVLNEHESGRLGDAVFMFILGGLSTLLFIRAIRAGVWITSDRVVIRGFLRTRRLPLGEVSNFVADSPTASWPFVKRVGHRSLAVTPLALGSWRGRALGADFPAQLRPTCQQLNTLLDSVRATAPHPISAPASVPDVRREFRPVHSVILAIAAIVWIICGVIAVLAPTTLGVIFSGGIALLWTIQTALMLHLAKKNIDRQVHASTDPTG